MTPPLPLEEAQRRLLASADALGGEHLPLDRCLGRYLVAPLAAWRTQPAADMSAMDGYAVAVPLPGPWRIVGESAAGRPHSGALRPGDAVRISTGALVPTGATAVLLQEEAAREGDTLALAEGGEASARHIRRRGFDFAEGDVVLDAGVRFGAGQLALAIAAGHGSAPFEVGRLPSVAVIDSGDELARDAEAWDDHKLPASNGAMIAAMVAPFARGVERIGPVPDRMDALAEALAHAEDADVVVTTGGASVGDHDLIRPALEAWGATIDFWRVAMKPGKPLLVARRGKAFVVGLPGNPVSSYVTAYFFVLPLLRRLGGARSCVPRHLVAQLEQPLPAGGPRREFLRAVALDGKVTPQTGQDSSALAMLGAANVLIDRPAGAPAAEAGSEVPVYPLDNGGIA